MSSKQDVELGVKETSQELHEAMDELIAAVKNESIEHRLFVQKYLPIFAGAEGVDERLTNDLLGFWLPIAKTAYTPVDVIGDMGEILYTVPPFWDNNTTIMAYDPSYNLTEEIRTASEKSNVLEQQGTRHVMDRIIPMMNEQQPKIEYLLAWDKIFTSNGYPSILPANMVVDKEVGLKAVDNTSNLINEDMEFDEI